MVDKTMWVVNSPQSCVVTAPQPQNQGASSQLAWTRFSNYFSLLVVLS